MILYLHSFLIVLFTSPAYLQDTDPATRISVTVKEFIRTGIKPISLDDDVASLYKLSNKTYKNQQECKTCQYVVDEILQYRRSGANKDDTVKLIQTLCAEFVWNNSTCTNYLSIGFDSILYMIDNGKNLTGARACAIYLQDRLCQDPESFDWSVNIPNKISDNLNNNVRQVANIGTVNEKLKVLHLTDIHFDPDYVPGSNARCGESLCCRGGKPEKPEDAAGFWGDYNVCDMPWHSVLNLMDQVTNQHPQIDYIYYTGDVMHHASHLLNRERNLNDIKRLFDLFYKTFNSTPVYPVLGNHESHPSDYYSAPNVSSDVSTVWLFNAVAEEWSKWLPEDAKQTIKIGGYYTVLAREGFRIIALNNNVCYRDNLWLIYDDVDPYGQLQWLVDTLAAAEENGEAVHILAHIPPDGRDCLKKWLAQYNKIISRFSRTVKAQFNGHTHVDEIKLLLNENDDNVINVAYNGASFTTFVGMNPNYRIYDMDNTTYQITDYDNWIFNITDANMDSNTPPNWYKLYTFKEAYGLNSTNMEDLFDWVQRMKDDPQKKLLKQYRRFYYRESDHYMKTGCDDKCLDKFLCTITSKNFEGYMNCNV